MTVGIGVIGYGYWGPNLVRNFSEIPNSRVVGVADISAERRDAAKARNPSVMVSVDPAEVIEHPDVGAVAIAAPVNTHYELAAAALRAGRHVLVEKPLAATSHAASALVAEAARRNRVLLVDHTFVYTGAVRKIVEMVRSGVLGDIHYYDSVRVNLGIFQSDVNVIWDLAVHDLAILDVVMGEHPVAVSAVGMSHVPGQPENIAYLTLFYRGRRIAHLHVNWLAPVKVRRTLIGCRDKMIVYDDLEPSEKVKIYDRGATLSEDPESRYNLYVSYRYGDMLAPRLDTAEGLRVEAIHFIECIRSGARPITDGASGLRIVRILEAAQESMNDGGRRIALPSPEEY